jgi:hypothetical protein
MRYKCLTICQPWAWAIIHGPKRIENRHWRIFHRGWLAIHAGKSLAYMDTLVLNDGTPVPLSKDLVFGAVIGLVKVVNCVDPRHERVRGNPFAEGPWCHVYDEPRPLARPFYTSGQRGIFDVDIPDEYLALSSANSR